MLSNDELLASPLVCNVLTPEEIQRAEADENWLVNDGMEDAKLVLTVAWDSSMPGTCGASWIREWRGLYFFDSSDVDSEGPFESLDDAMEVDLFMVFSDGLSLESDVIPLEELIDIAYGRFDGNEGDTIQINDNTYELTQTGFVLQEEPEGGQP